MTQSTSADVKEIQDRNATARGRVIEATMALGVTVDPALIQAAMMELAAIWREEAAWFTAQKRKGHVSISKELIQAAARLSGFAVGLTTRPAFVTGPSIPGDPGYREAEHGRPQAPCYECVELDEDPAPWCDCRDSETCKGPCRKEAHPFHAHPQGCRHFSRTPAKHAGRATCPYCGERLSLDAVVELVNALPEGDSVANVFTSPLTVVSAEPGDESHIAWTPPADAAARLEVVASDQSEEQNLREIIGPLGASVTATIDHPFTNPGIPWLNQRRAVEVVPFHELPIVAAATPPRDHVSHSYVESYEGCSLSAMLRDASRAGQIGASRPGWSQIGGKAFHAAVEQIERLAVSGVEMIRDDHEALWLQHFDAQVRQTMDELVGTPYADSATWYISNRGKEGFDWWRVEGAKMLGLYVKHHTAEWRAANPTFLLQDKTPVIELPYEMSIRSLDGERGLTAQGFIDKATLDMSTYSLTVLDYKTGSREPESTFQLGEYGHALLMAMGIANEPADRPILGRYWLARKGIYTDAVPVVTRHPLTELQYRYDNAARGTKAGIFAPHVTNLCKSCSVTDYCPAQAGRG